MALSYLAHLNLILIFLISLFYGIYVAVKSCFMKKKETDKYTVGFFHPYCNAGGGGERVLWVALRTLQTKHRDCQFVIYTGDIGVRPREMISNAKSRFNIVIEPDNVEFIYLQTRTWVEADKYPSFTLIGQSVGSIYMGFEALSKCKPDFFIDTMGYAFTLPLFKFLARCTVACYIHYPTISTDMLAKVADRSESFNNQSLVAKSSALSSAKMVYYKSFAALYSLVGRASDVIMVNSSWTENHINHLWKRPSRTFKIYPPCDVNDFMSIPLPKDDSSRSVYKILSVAQFRPEKDHILQIRVMDVLRTVIPIDLWKKVKLVLIGSVRNEDDALRVENLKTLVEKLSLVENVKFRINVSFQELKDELAVGLIGIHTMWNEHFGISIVECLAAGLIMVAHKSGGPLMDIIIQDEGQRNGFLAAEAVEYANVIKKILSLTPSEKSDIRSMARESVERFSEEQFSKKFMQSVEPYLN